MRKFISWNIDSLNAALTSASPRAQLSRDVLNTLKNEDADIIAIQETKLPSAGPSKKHLEALEEYFPGKKITFILGILADKEVDIILDTLLPIADRCYTMAVPNPRTMPPEKLAEMIRARGIDAAVLPDNITLDSIKENADVICIAGSLYLISQISNESKA